MKAARILYSLPPKAGTLGLEHASSSRLSWLLGSRWKPFEDCNQSPEALPPDMVPPGSENKIMHTSFRIGDADRGQVQMPGLGPSTTISMHFAPNGVTRAPRGLPCPKHIKSVGEGRG
jgi:hypothetical protein